MPKKYFMNYNSVIILKIVKKRSEIKRMIKKLKRTPYYFSGLALQVEKERKLGQRANGDVCLHVISYFSCGGIEKVFQKFNYTLLHGRNVFPTLRNRENRTQS